MSSCCDDGLCNGASHTVCEGKNGCRKLSSRITDEESDLLCVVQGGALWWWDAGLTGVTGGLCFKV